MSCKDDIVAAMLGNLEIVQALIRSYPQTRHSCGPHGIPLLQHAIAGGEEAASVLAWLQAGENA